MRLCEIDKPIEQVIQEALMCLPEDDSSTATPLVTDTEAQEKARLLRLAKARGLDMSPPKVTPEQIIQAGNAPPVARMLVTDKTTPAEISAFIRGQRRG